MLTAMILRCRRDDVVLRSEMKKRDINVMVKICNDDEDLFVSGPARFDTDSDVTLDLSPSSLCQWKPLPLHYLARSDDNK